jgi:hypothetical protein
MRLADGSRPQESAPDFLAPRGSMTSGRESLVLVGIHFLVLTLRNLKADLYDERYNTTAQRMKDAGQTDPSTHNNH